MDEYVKSCVEKLRDEAQSSEWWKHTSGRPIIYPFAPDICTKFRGPRDGIDDDSDIIGLSKEEKGEAKNHWDNISGDDGEVAVMRAFERSKIGGVLFRNFHSEEFYDNLEKYKPKKINEITEANENDGKITEGKGSKKEMKKDEKPEHFQVDFIYVHPWYGIFVIEVCNFSGKIPLSLRPSATISEINGLNRLMEKCAKMPNYVEKISELHQSLIGETAEEDLPLPRALVFFPSAEVETAPYPVTISHNENDPSPICLHILDKKSATNLDEFFLQFRLQMRANPLACLLHRSLYEQLVGPLIFYRPAECFDMSYAIYLVNEMIKFGAIPVPLTKIAVKKDEISTKKKKKKKKKAQVQAKAVNNIHARPLLLVKETYYLNHQQRKVFDNVNRRKLLFGRQGTGKTLLVRLLLQKCREIDKTGKIYVVSGADHLDPIFDEVGTHRNNHPIVQDFLDVDEISDCDHFFADEAFVPHQEWQKFLAKRAQLKDVWTVIAICGAIFFNDSDELKNYFEAKIEIDGFDTEAKLEIGGFDKIQLCQVFRNTRAIAHFLVEKGLHGPPVPVHGHNVQGAWPIEEVLPTAKQVLERMLFYLNLLNRKNKTDNHAADEFTGYKISVAILVNSFYADRCQFGK